MQRISERNSYSLLYILVIFFNDTFKMYEPLELYKNVIHVYTNFMISSIRNAVKIIHK